MRTQLVLRSSAFPAYDGEEHQINPGRFGRRLAEAVAALLATRGYATSEPMAEDWGWRVEVRNDAFPLWLGCGNVDGEVDKVLREDPDVTNVEWS
ncbi:MAG TPA: hypothetical protein VLI04_00045 [Nocardioidaceae bacterium]|nr:hypothetical protein [Nocardioidaceae bacterium]